MASRSNRPRIVKRSSDRLVLREDARHSFVLYLVVAGCVTAAASLAGPGFPVNSAGLCILAVLLLLVGANRITGMVSTFDSVAGTVTVAHMLGKRCVMRRRFSMSEVTRVYYDARAYLRLDKQNPRLEMNSGRTVNLSRWCKTEADLEDEVAAANRLLHRWKQARAAEDGRELESFPKAYANAHPRAWTLEELGILSDRTRSRAVLLLKRSSIGLVVLMVIVAIDRTYFASEVGVLLGVAADLALITVAVTGALVLLDKWLR